MFIELIVIIYTPLAAINSFKSYFSVCYLSPRFDEKKFGLKSDYSNMSQGFTAQLGHAVKKMTHLPNQKMK